MYISAKSTLKRIFLFSFLMENLNIKIEISYGENWKLGKSNSVYCGAQIFLQSLFI